MIDVSAALAEGQVFKHIGTYLYRITKIGIKELHLTRHIVQLKPKQKHRIMHHIQLCLVILEFNETHPINRVIQT